VKALSGVFKAKMCEALRSRNVTIPEPDKLMLEPWCVYSKPSLSTPETVITETIVNSRANRCRRNKRSFIQQQPQRATSIKKDATEIPFSHHWACPICKQGE
jgi:hypothetical protein